MKTIRNKSTRPLRIALPGGKTLHLGPQKTGQVAEPTLERPAFKKLVAAGDVEILEDGGPGAGGASSEGPRMDSQGGHARSAIGHRSGNR